MPQEQVQPELQTESKQSEQPEAVQQQTPQPVQQKKEKNSKEEEDLEEEGPQLRPARFLYNMCECDKVSNPGTLQKLMTKKKKVRLLSEYLGYNALMLMNLALCAMGNTSFKRPKQCKGRYF